MMNCKRKAQVKLFESIAVLIVFVFLVAIGMKFYTNAQLSSLREAQSDFSQLDAVKTSVVLSHLPEIGCSEDGLAQSTCLDLFKIIAWNTLLHGPDSLVFVDSYLPLLGFSEITVTRLYPLYLAGNSWTIYNASVENVSSDLLQIPMLLYDPVKDKHQFGVLKIRTYYE
jgi:hypothetical protein